MNRLSKHNAPSLSDLRSHSLGTEWSQRSQLPSKRALPYGFSDDTDAAKGKHRRSSSCPSAALSPVTSAVFGPPSPIHDASIPATLAPVMSNPSVTDASTSTSSSVPSLSAVVAASISASRQSGTVLTVRKLYEDIVHARYPHHQPANDFELYALGCNDYSYIAPGQLSAHLAQEWSYFVTMKANDSDVAMASITTLLGKRAEITGVKPLPADPEVTIIPIPQSPYALRMWPGSRSRREYCIDFVYAADLDKSLNVPQGYSLSVHIPNPSFPWLGVGVQDLQSFEENCGVLEKDLKEGGEKFIVRDGVNCLLVYATEEDSDDRQMWFKVPVRPVQVRKDGNE